MTERAYATMAVGLESTSKGLKGAKLSYSQRKPQIDDLFHLFFDVSKKKAHLKDQVREQLGLSSKALVVTSIDANEVLIRPLEIKLKKSSDIDAVLGFQAEPILPYPLDACLLDRIKVSQISDGKLLTLLAVKKEHVQRSLEHWTSLGIEPEVVATVPSSLVAYSRFALQDDLATVFILHLGDHQTSCTFAKEGKLIASKATHHGVMSLKDTFRSESMITDDALFEKEFSMFNWGTIDPQVLPITAQKLKTYSIEIEKLVFALMKQARELEIPPIMVTGEGSENSELAKFLPKGFHGKQLSLSPKVITKYSEAELNSYAIPIGEALTALHSYEDQVNFLQEEFVYAHPWKRLMKPLFIYFALCLGLALAFWTFGKAYIASEENVIRSKYAELLATMHKSHADFEKEIADKNNLGIDQDIPPLESLTLDEISDRMDLLEKELKQVPDLFPLTPNVPKVSDVLAWLSVHPNIVGKDPSNPLILIEGFSYVLIKRPELNKKFEKYQTKVEIDFTSANATAAREFHDALLQPNNFIDPKAEVKWTNNKGRYRATFMLKDRTVYP
jgi:type IV pilus assembly protein PilM